VVYSYEFDANGKIAKKLNTKQFENDTILTLFEYDKFGKVKKKMIYSKRSDINKKIDTMETNLFYNVNGRIISSINYSVRNNVKYEDWSKVECVYTSFDSLEKFILYDYWPKKGYDTAYMETYFYNSKKLLESVISRDFYGYYSGYYPSGATKFRYDQNSKLEEVNHYSKRGKYNEIDSPINNYTIYYNYVGDTLVSETCMQQDYYSKDVTIRDYKGRLKQKYSSKIRFSNTLHLKKDMNVLDIEQNVNEITNDGTTYLYDEFGRIIKIIYPGDNKDKVYKWSASGISYKLFIYDKDKKFVLPEEEYEKY